jgi:hypothetical protein
MKEQGFLLVEILEIDFTIHVEKMSKYSQNTCDDKLWKTCSSTIPNKQYGNYDKLILSMERKN